MTTVENHLNHPVPTRATDAAAAVVDVAVNVKIDVKVANKSNRGSAVDDDEDVVLDGHRNIEITPEADEEIDSEVEGADYEDKMLQAALANSVADHQKIQAKKVKQENYGADNSSSSAVSSSPPLRSSILRVTAPDIGCGAGDIDDPNEPSRYGLRKRRRQQNKDDSDDDKCSDGATTPRAGVATKKRGVVEESPSSRRSNGKVRHTGDEGTDATDVPPNQKARSTIQGVGQSSTTSRARAPKAVTPAGMPFEDESRKAVKRSSPVPNPLLSSSSVCRPNSVKSKKSKKTLPDTLPVPCPLPAMDPLHESMPAPVPVSMESGMLHQRPRVFSVDLDRKYFLNDCQPCSDC